MAKINRVRLINVTYNNRTATDMIFNLNGKNAMTILRNAGGKTVLLKFIITSFLWGYKKYPKNAKNPIYCIEDFFKKERGPCYICNELLLENGEYLLLIVGIYKNTEDDDLVKYAFCRKYEKSNDVYAINRFPFFEEDGKLLNPKKVYEKYDKEKIFTTFGTNTKKRFIDFREYMNNENNIKISFFEDIAIKVLKTEGGISEVFNEYPTFQLLLKDFIIPITAKKAFEDEDHDISMLSKILSKHIYNEKSFSDRKILKQEYEKLEEKLHKLNEKLNQRNIIDDNLKKTGYNIRRISIFSQAKETELLENFNIIKDERNKIAQEIQVLKADFVSFQIKENNKKIEKINDEIIKISNELKRLDEKENSLKTKIEQYKAYLLHCKLDENKSKEYLLKLRTAPLDIKRKELKDKQTRLGGQIFNSINYLKKERQKELDLVNAKITQFKKEILDLQLRNKEIDDEISNLFQKEEQLKYANNLFEKEVENLKEEYSDFNIKFIDEKDELEKRKIERYLVSLEQDKQKLENELKNNTNQILNFKNRKKELNIIIKELLEEKTNKDKKLTQQTEELKNFNKSYDKLTRLIEKNGFSIHDLENIVFLYQRLTQNIEELQTEKDLNLIELDKANTQLNDFQNKKILNSKLIKILEENKIPFDNGFDFLNEYSANESVKENLYNKVPQIIYSIIIQESDLKKLEKIIMDENLSDFCIPILIKERLNYYDYTKINSIVKADNMFLFANFPNEIYKSDYIEKKKIEFETNVKNLEDKKEKLYNKYSSNLELSRIIQEFINNYGEINYKFTLENNIALLQNELKTISLNIINKEEENKQIDNEVELDYQKINDNKKEISDIGIKIEKIHKIITNSINYYNNKLTLSNLSLKKENLNKNKLKNENKIEINNKDKELYLEKKNRSENDIIILNKKRNKYITYKHHTINSEEKYDIDNLEYEFNKIEKEIEKNISSDEEYLKHIQEEIHKIEKDLFKYAKIDKDPSYLKENWTYFNEEKIQTDIDKIRKEIKIQDQNLGSRKTELEIAKDKENELQKELLDTKGEYNKDAENKPYHELIKKCQEAYNNAGKKYNNIQEEGNKIRKFNNNEIKKWENSGEKYSKIDIPNTYNCPVNIDIENYKNYFNDWKEEYQKYKTENIKTDKEIETQLSNIKIEFISSVEKVKLDIQTIISAEKSNRLSKNDIDIILQRIDKWNNLHKDEFEKMKKDKENLYIEFKNKAQSLLDSLKRLHNVSNKVKIDDQQLIKFNRLNQLNPEILKLKEYITTLIDQYIPLDLTIEQMEIQIQDKISPYLLLLNYTNLNSLDLIMMKQDANEWQKISYHDFITTKLSGAQKILTSLILLQTLILYENDSGTGLIKVNSSNFLFQDNPFGKLSTKDYLDTFFKFSEQYNLQHWSWTDNRDSYIIKLHDNVHVLKIQRYNNKEFLQVDESENIKEQIKAANIEYERKTIS